MNTINNSLEEAYKELGKAYYEGRFEDPLPELLPLFDEITKLRTAMQQKECFCPQCGNVIKKQSKFCAKCGYKLEVI